MSENAIIFDTHKFVSRLVKTGMAEATAEALADEQIRLINSNLATKQDIEELRAATKQDLAEVEAEVKHDIEQLRAATKHDIALIRRDIEQLRAETKQDIAEIHQKLAETKVDLIKWVSGLMVAQAGVIVALVKLI